MSTDQDARAGWSPDRRELVAPDSEVLDGYTAPPGVGHPAADPKEQAVEWMRWMGFTDAESARVGVSLFLFDQQQDTGSAAGQSAGLMSQEPATASDQSRVPLLFDGSGPPDFGVPVYPTLVSDDRAVAVIRKERQGLLANREVLEWVRQSWVPLYRIRTDFTSKCGPRGELRFASLHQLFDTVSGQPITFKGSKHNHFEVRQSAGPAFVAIQSRVPAADVIDRTVEIWNDYCRLTDKVAQKRSASVLAARGVPSDVAHTINLELDSRILLPVFVGLLRHSTGQRLVALDGVDCRHQAGLSSALTLNLRSVQDELDGNRLLRLATS
jgi:hypothetical protein